MQESGIAQLKVLSGPTIGKGERTDEEESLYDADAGVHGDACGTERDPGKTDHTDAGRGCTLFHRSGAHGDRGNTIRTTGRRAGRVYS